MSDDEEPVALGAPIPPMTEADIIRYARGVLTNEYLLADANDREWQMSLMLILSAWRENVPANMSCLFLVPMAEHQGGRWLNGRVPGVTMSAIPVAIESVDPLLTKCREFYLALHPGEEQPGPV